MNKLLKEIIWWSLCFQGRCLNFSRVPHHPTSRAAVWSCRGDAGTRFRAFLFLFLKTKCCLFTLCTKFLLSARTSLNRTYLPPFPWRRARRRTPRSHFVAAHQRFTYSHHIVPSAEKKNHFMDTDGSDLKKKNQQIEGTGATSCFFGLEVRMFPAGLTGPFAFSDVSSRLFGVHQSAPGGRAPTRSSCHFITEECTRMTNWRQDAPRCWTAPRLCPSVCVFFKHTFLSLRAEDQRINRALSGRRTAFGPGRAPATFEGLMPSRPWHDAWCFVLFSPQPALCSVRRGASRPVS